MNITKTLIAAALLVCSTSAFAWLANSQTGLVPVVVPTTMQCPVEYYNTPMTLTFLGSQAEVASYNEYHEYLDSQYAPGAMTYEEWLVQHPVKITVQCPNNPMPGGMG